MEPEWDACLQTLEGHTNIVSFVALSSDGTCIASASTDETLKVWDASSGACLQTLEIHDGWAIPMVLFSDAGRTYIFSLSENTNSIKIWDASSGVCVQTLEVFGQPLALVHMLLLPQMIRLSKFGMLAVIPAFKPWRVRGNL